MDRSRSPRPPRSRRLPRLTLGLCAAGAPLLGLGCSTSMEYLAGYGPSPPAAQAAPAVVVPAAHAQALPAPKAVAGGQQGRKEVPIPFDGVFRLAEENNARINLARARLQESEAAVCRAAGACLHKAQARLQAERQRLQDQGELARVRNEVLLDAGQTYVDLLTARRGEAVGREIDQSERRLLEEAERLALGQPAARAQAAGLRATQENRQVTLSKLRQQGDAASAKLAYLLGLPPGAAPAPADSELAPVDLVDATLPTEALVAQALADGPGVREMEGLLALIHEGIALLSSRKHLLTALLAHVFERACGACRGSSRDGDGRLNPGPQSRGQRLRTAEMKLQQAQWSYQDLRGKLTAGVQEAKGAVLASREQIGLSTAQLRQARESYRLSDERLREPGAGGSVAEVALALRGLEQAHFNYLTAVSAYNKAQVRLVLLLGPGPAPHGPGCRHP